MASNDSVSAAEGIDVNSEEAECSAWIEVESRKKNLGEKAHNSQAALEQRNGCGGVRTCAQSRGVMRRVVKAFRILNMPRDNFKTIVRSRGGLDVREADLIAFKRALAKAAFLMVERTCENSLCANRFQNILIIATPLETNARANAKVLQVCVGIITTEVAAYVATSDDMCKGVICGINPDISEA
ncbi:hypothetical protein HPB51_011388 [Rhipicephalus microplus]|uniref:Uncharacterized protein n=1 Tax=Rhipicephalus microplus TaxID=6941 RepID=A0A9J6F371_RHIMP|nr:hypothetical protein HPB51_011388 [Rhipicephalus microplus]